MPYPRAPHLVAFVSCRVNILLSLVSFLSLSVKYAVQAAPLSARSKLRQYQLVPSCRGCVRGDVWCLCAALYVLAVLWCVLGPAYYAPPITDER